RLDFDAEERIARFAFAREVAEEGVELARGEREGSARTRRTRAGEHRLSRDHAVQPDEFALEVPHGTAAVSGVDFRVVLNGVDVLESTVEMTARPGNHAERRDGSTVLAEEERIARGDRPGALAN